MSMLYKYFRMHGILILTPPLSCQHTLSGLCLQCYVTKQLLLHLTLKQSYRGGGIILQRWPLVCTSRFLLCGYISVHRCACHSAWHIRLVH